MTSSPDSDSVQYSIDGGQAPSTAIIDAVAAVTDSAPTSYPPLYTAVDPDELDALFADRDNGTVTFEYAGCDIMVDSDSTVSVTPQ